MTPQSLTITIPMQMDRRITPNGRAHWAVKRKLAEELQQATHWAMKEAVNLNDPVACFQQAQWPLVLDYEIGHGKGRKRLDDDNAISGMKPIRDQIARCLGMDDRDMRTGDMVQARDPEKKGYIKVTITESEAQGVGR